MSVLLLYQQCTESKFRKVDDQYTLVIVTLHVG